MEKNFVSSQGCLVPIKVIIPEGTLLNPYQEAAVVGGNVLTSQRVVDVVLKAFGACAASQGCMNNITFGDETMGYYETVAGGSGAVKFFLFQQHDCLQKNWSFRDLTGAAEVGFILI